MLTQFHRLIACLSNWSLVRIMVCDEGPPAAVERDGAYVVGLVRERNAGRVQFLEVVLTMPLGLAKRISFYHEQLRTLQLQFTVQHSLV